MSPSSPLRASAAAALAAVALLAGCGGDDDQAAGPDVRANGTDAAFVSATIPHHEAAVDAADLALSRAEHRPLERLAEGIVQFRSADLATLRTVRGVLQDAGVEEGDLGLDEQQIGSVDAAALTELRNANDFDCSFLELMIPHHEGGIRIARAELESGIHAELRRMSENLIDDYRFELRQMRRYQRSWCAG